jgi:hypothetical protein
MTLTLPFILKGLVWPAFWPTRLNGHLLGAGRGHAPGPDVTPSRSICTDTPPASGTRADNRGRSRRSAGPAPTRSRRPLRCGGLVRRRCVAESIRWTNRGGNLGEVGIAPVWVALAEWMAGNRRADPVGVLRVTARRVYAPEAAGVELGMGGVNRPRPLVRAATQGQGAARCRCLN